MAQLVDEGARIAVGDPILAVEKDKISAEEEAADPGLLRRKVAPAGQTLPVKALLGVMAEAEVSDQEIASLRIKRDKFHGEWNYTLLPRP